MTHQHQNVDPAVDFPEMRYIPGIQEDHAAYLQCLVQMTQVLGNAHDLLYPSKSRSVALAKAEQYYQHIDDFAESETIPSAKFSPLLFVNLAFSFVGFPQPLAKQTVANVSHQ